MSKLVQLKRITDGGPEAKPPAAGGYGGLRAKPPVAGRFFKIFLENVTLLMPWITFRTLSEPFETTKFLRFESQLKKFLTLLEVKSKTRL